MTWLGVILGLALVLWALNLRRSTGLPWQRIAYSDTGAWQRNETALFARRHGLVGKPDYIVDSRHGPVPVEVKPGRRARKPYASDMLQLAAYCLLVEETTGVRPAYGLLRYAETTFKVRFDQQIRDELLGVLAKMREFDPRHSAHRSHEQAARCRGCGFRSGCDESLA